SVRAKYYQPDVYQSLNDQSKLSLNNSNQHISPLHNTTTTNPLVSNKILSQSDMNQIDDYATVRYSHSNNHDRNLMKDLNRNHYSDQQTSSSHYSSRRKHCRMRKHHKTLENNNERRSPGEKFTPNSISDKIQKNKLRNDTISNTSSGFSSYNHNSVMEFNSTGNLNSIHDISSVQQKLNSIENMNSENKQHSVYYTPSLFRNGNEKKKLKINNQTFSTLSNQLNHIPYDTRPSTGSPHSKQSFINVPNTMKKSSTDFQLSNSQNNSKIINEQHWSKSQYPIQMYYATSNNIHNNNSNNDPLKYAHNENVIHSMSNNNSAYGNPLSTIRKKSLHRSNSSGSALTSLHPKQYTVKRTNDAFFYQTCNSTLRTKHSQMPPFALKYDINNTSNNNNENINYTNYNKNTVSISNDRNHHSHDKLVDQKSFYTRLDIPRLGNHNHNHNAPSPIKQYQSVKQSKFQIHPPNNHQQFIDPVQLNGKMTNVIIDENTFCLLNAEE
ncbi:unnamed protein product, partial [Schistosoma turkestanicum]